LRSIRPAAPVTVIACEQVHLARISPEYVGTPCDHRDVITVDDVRDAALRLPRSYEAIVRDQIKFRVGRIVYVAFSRDETVMGFAYPKEERPALIAAESETFLMPAVSDQRYNWVDCSMAALDEDRMRELVIDAWRMVVPKFLHDHPSTFGGT
jgi:hypothetical protein